MKFSYLKYPWGSAWCGMMLFSGAKNILLDSADFRQGAYATAADAAGDQYQFNIRMGVDSHIPPRLEVIGENSSVTLGKCLDFYHKYTS